MPAATAAVASKPAPDQEIPKVSGAPQEKIDTLEKRLTALEETISSLQAKALTRTDIESLELAVGKMQQEAEKAKVEAEEKARAEEAAKAVKTKAKAKVAKTKVKKTKTASVSRKAQPASNWVLKSAKPGMAWVAEKGSSELNTVSVGGTLRGIGKITSIEKDSAGRWVVGGTEGKISQ
jgi:TolA-binding protein